MIKFHRIQLQNFLSVGNHPVVIELDTHKTTLIHGVNGSGKSTILDALCYVLYNHSFRKINLSQLINSQNGKGLEVAVEFSIGNTTYMVRRGQKPKIFEIYVDNQLVISKSSDKEDQKYLEETILKLSYKSFTQIVILGSSSFIPFMQLTAQGRRECVEDFLDIKVFSSMSILAKEKYRSLKEQCLTIDRDISELVYKLDIQKDRIEEMEAQTEDKLAELNEKIKDNSIGKSLIQQEIQILMNRERDINSQLDALIKKKSKDKALEFSKVLYTLNSKISDREQTIKFYSTNNSCDTCHQHIEEEAKQKHISKSESDILEFTDATVKIKEMIGEQQKITQEADALRDSVDTIQREIFKLQQKINVLDTLTSSYESEISTIKSKSSSIDKERGKKEALLEQMNELEVKKSEFNVDLKDHEIVVSLLKDSGIKSHIVKKYIPVMNKLISKYLSIFDFPIHFELDEQFNESCKSPLYQSFTYDSFSEGQKSRIDLSLLFTWRDIGKLKNSVSVNLLILDEVFSSSLDEVGKENLLNLLRFNLDNTNVLVVDHTLNDTFKEKFNKAIEVKKIKGFSEYK